MAFDQRRAFSDLCQRAYLQVKTDHTTSYTTKIKGFFNNQTRRIQNLSATSGFFDSCRLVLSFALRLVPIVGSIASTAAGAAMNYAKNQELKKEVADASPEKWAFSSWTNPRAEQTSKTQAFDRAAMQVQGELLISSLAQKYHDALGKYEEARNNAVKRPDKFANCSEIGAYLRTFYYWRYRMVRLRYYHDQVVTYCRSVAAHMEKEEAEFLKFNAKLMDQGPAMFADWKWHYANCTDECYWPEDFNISSPTNSRETIQRLSQAGLTVYPRSAFTVVNGTPVLATGPTPPAYPPPPPQVQTGPRPPSYPPPPSQVQTGPRPPSYPPPPIGTQSQRLVVPPPPPPTRPRH